MPALFVLLWSSGYVGALYGLPHAEPMTILTIRYLLVGAVLFVAAILCRSTWPIRALDWLHAGVVGVLIHVGCLGGVFLALDTGVEAGTVALIVSAQPLLTGAIAGLFGKDAVTRKQWFGLVVGFLGVVLIVWHKLRFDANASLGITFAAVALVSITLGALYQRRYCARMSLLCGNTIQFVFATILCATLALAFETRVINWSGELVFSIAWLVIVLSLGATTLLYLLIRSNRSVGVASLFYLVPPITALMAFVSFGERMPGAALAGMGLTVLGVALVRKDEAA